MAKTSVVFMLLMISGQIGALAQEGGTHVRPILRLEKPKYLLGESIRFWVGVEPEGSREIPREYQKACSLSITKAGRNHPDPICWVAGRWTTEQRVARRPGLRR